MKKFLKMLFTAMLTVSLVVGCSPNHSHTSTAILYSAYGSEPYLTLDPSMENSNGVCILQNVYETLTRYNDKTGEVEPFLAKSWTHNEIGRAHV